MSTEAKTHIKRFISKLNKEDVTLVDWARKHEFPIDVVYGVCSGRLQGYRGTARKVVRAMGMPAPDRVQGH
jgi:gp16 family phage-associated protein